MTPFQTFLRRWYEPSTLPIVVVVGAAFVGCAYYCGRLLNHHEVVFNRNRPHPWNEMSPTDQPRKFLLVNKQKFEQLKQNAPQRDY